LNLLFSSLGALVVIVHLLFVVFVVAGSLLVLRWRRAVFLHVPAVIWAAFIELSGGVCPLTPLENALRARAGLDEYDTDFVARYLFPFLYPAGLTRRAQVFLGLLVLVANVAVYAWFFRTWRRSERSL
jgi:hypothetical protein